MASLKTRGVALATLIAFTSQSFFVFAQGIILDPSAGTANAQLRSGAVPVVDIAPPSAAGLSHNKFTGFNVGAEGVILNNSAAGSETGIAGHVSANARLNAGNEARVILNEVTGTGYSTLHGVTEIAGEGAEYILANPNGVWCNGCGFINTPDVTIASGTPEVVGGELTRLRVPAGWVLVDNTGLDAGDDTGLNVISRYVRVNGDINARSISVVAGANDVDMQTGVVTAHAAPTPYYFGGIDSTAMGGMYAGQITLVATEAGVGVNLAQLDLAATRGDIRISADGKLTVGAAAAADDLVLNSANDAIELSGTAFAGGSASAVAASQITVADGAILAAQHDVHINAQSLISSGTVVAGAGQDAGNADAGLLWIGTDQDVANQGDIQAGALVLESGTGSIDNSGGSITADTVVAIAAAEFRNDGGSIEAAQALTLSGGDISNRAGRIVAAGNGSIDAGNVLDNSAGVVVLDGNDGLLAANTISNEAGTILHAGAGTLAISAAADLNNDHGRIGSAGTVALAVSAIATNGSGEIVATAIGGDIGTLSNNDGVLEAAAIALEVGDDLNNQRGLISVTGDVADAMYLVVGESINNGAGAILSNAQSGLVSASTLRNTGGEIAQQGSGALLLAVDGLINGGEIVSNGELLLNGSSVANAGGAISAAGLLRFALTGGLDNRRGLIQSHAALQVFSATLQNDEGVMSDRGTAGTIVDIEGLLSNQRGVIQSDARNLDIFAQIIDSAGGEILHAGDGWLGLSGDIGASSSRLHSNGSIDISTDYADLSNASVAAAGDVYLWAAQGINNDDGEVLAGGIVDVIAGDAGLTNRYGSFRSVGSGTSYYSSSGGFDNYSGVVFGDELSIGMDTIDNVRGVLAGETVVKITAQTLNNVLGRIVAADVTSVDVQYLENLGGEISADGVLDLVVPATGESAGALFGREVLRLDVDGDFVLDAGASLTGSGSLLVEMPADAVFHNAGTIDFIGDITGSGDSFINDETAVLRSGGDSSLSFAAFLNLGTIEAGGNLSVSAVRAENHGTVTAARNIAIRPSEELINYGFLHAGEDVLVYTAGALSNLTGAGIYGGRDVVLAGGEDGSSATQVLNSSARMEAADRLLISAAEIINQRTEFDVGPRLPATGLSGISVSDPLCSSGCNGFYELTESIGDEVRALSAPAVLASGGNMYLSGGAIENLHSDIVAEANLLLTGESLRNVGSDLVSVIRTTRWNRAGQSGTALSEIDAEVLAYNREAVGAMHLDNGAGYTYTFPNGGDYFRYADYYRSLGWQVEVDEIGASASALDKLRALATVSVADVAGAGHGSSGGQIQAGEAIYGSFSGAVENIHFVPASESIVPDLGGMPDISLTGEPADESAVRISGQAVYLQAGEFLNDGTLRGTALLSLTSGGVFRNLEGGELRARDIVVDAGTDITVESGLVSATESLRMRAGGSFLATAGVAAQFDIYSGFAALSTSTSTGAGLETQLISEGDVSIVTGADLQLFASIVDAAGDLRFSAAGDVDILGDIQTHAYWQINFGLYPSIFESTAEKLVASRVSTGGDLSLQALGDINVNGALLNAGQTAQVHAAGAVDIAAARLMQTRSLHGYTNSVYELAESTRVESGGALDISGATLRVEGSDLSAADDIQLLSGADVALDATRLDSIDGYWSAGTYYEPAVTTDYLVTTLLSQGDIDLIAGGSLQAFGSDLISAGDISLTANQDIDLQSVASLYDFWRTNRKWFVRHTGVTNDLVDIGAGGEFVGFAGGSFSAGGVEIVAGDDLIIDASGKIDIAAVNDSRYYLYALSKNGSSRRHEIIDDITRATSLEAGGDIALTSGLSQAAEFNSADISIVGGSLSADGDIEINAGRDLIFSVAQDVYREYYQKKSKGSFGRSSSASTEIERVTSVPVVLAAGENISLSARRNIAIQAARVAASGDVTVSALAGRLALLVATDIDRYSHEASSASAFWQSTSGDGYYDTDVLMSRLSAGGSISLNAGSGVYVEHLGTVGHDYSDREVLEATLDQLVAEDAGYAWLGDLKNRNDVGWQHVLEVHESWAYEQQGLSQLGSAIVTLVAAYVSGGAALDLAGSAGLSGWTGAAFAGASTAAASTAAVGLINNQGDIGATLEALFSADSLRNIGANAITGGLLHSSVTSNINFSFSPDYLADVALESAVSAAVDSTIFGGSLSDRFSERLIASFVADAGDYAANLIGVEYNKARAQAGHGTGEVSSSVYWAHKAKHAALGCALGELTYGSCSGGAVGGFVGEIIAEEYHNFGFSDSQLGNTEAIGYDQLKSNGVALAQLGGIIAASAVGSDIDAAGYAAENAAENNAFFLAIIPALGVALETLDKYLIGQQLLNLEEAIRTGDDQRAAVIAEELAIEAGVEFTVGHLIPGSQIAANLLTAIKRRKVDNTDVRDLDISTQYSGELTPVSLAEMPSELTLIPTSGVKIAANGKTTTILGSFDSDMSRIIEELEYPKTLDFGPKVGGYNVLNTPDELYVAADQFWEQYNKLFLDMAVSRGDSIVLATKPTTSALNRKLASGELVRSGFGREIDYLKSVGYRYNARSNVMELR